MLATQTAAYDPDTEHTGSRLLALAKIAIDNALQPIVETVSGETYGYESLLRGHEKLAFSSPVALLDAFARTGHLDEIEHFAHARALAKFCSLPGGARNTLFLNLDYRLIRAGDRMIDSLLPYLEQNRIAPSSICFELSERFDNASLPEFSAFMSRLRDLGFKVAVDDFGTGHAEMKLLSQFDLDYLKIDRHLISGIDASPKKRHLTKSIVDMAHVLGLRVIAEGVETESEFLICRDLAVDLVQGWFIARPSVVVDELKVSHTHLRDVGHRRPVRRSLDEILIRQQVQHVPTISENDAVDGLFELFLRHPDQLFFPVIDSKGEPRGIVQESSLKGYIYQPYGRELLKNRVYSRSIAQFIDPAPVVSIETDSARLIAIFSGSEDAKCVILTEGRRYAGVISAQALIKIINEKQLRLAQDQNPLTGLPGNQAIRSFMEETMSDGDAVRHLCYCDFDNFKPFNDHYGFQRGDQAIALFAGLLKRHFFSHGTFLGHVGGDDFFAGLRGWTTPELERGFERLLADFNEAMLELYSAEDRKRGYITSQDRSGQLRDYGVVRCSTAVLEIPAGRVAGDANSLSNRIATLKKQAKEDSRGLVFAVLE